MNTLGFTICKAPCVTVTYRMALDKFSMTSEKMTHVAGGPGRGVCWIQFSRTVQFEVVSDENIWHLKKHNSFLHTGRLYCQERGSSFWIWGRHGSVAGLVSFVTWKLSCKSIPDGDKC